MRSRSLREAHAFLAAFVQLRMRVVHLRWVGCVAGALTDDEYRGKPQAAGFEPIEIQATRVYNLDDAREFLGAAGLEVDTIASQIEGKSISAFVRARTAAKV